MTRKLRSITLIVAVVALACVPVWLLNGPVRGIRVGTAVVSKTLCSGVFVSGLDPDLLYAEAIKPIPGQDLLAKHLKYTVDRTGRQVTTNWRGGFESRAIYRDGLGCMLLHGAVPASSFVSGSIPSTIATPTITDAVDLRSPELEAALDRAFAEPAQPPYRSVKAIVILHDGKLVAERYAPGYSVSTPILGYSLANP